MEIIVSFKNNTGSRQLTCENTKTIREFLEENRVDYSRGITALDGTHLMAGDYDKTFADFGVNTKCVISQVVKADNAR